MKINRRKGLTLIELLTVMAIIGILSVMTNRWKFYEGLFKAATPRTPMDQMALEAKFTPIPGAKWVQIMPPLIVNSFCQPSGAVLQCYNVPQLNCEMLVGGFTEKCLYEDPTFPKIKALLMPDASRLRADQLVHCAGKQFNKVFEDKLKVADKNCKALHDEFNRDIATIDYTHP